MRRGRQTDIDGVGIALIALASATLEVALDRGQIEDWFGSPFICWMLALAMAGWIATMVWEMRAQDPVIDFSPARQSQFRHLQCACSLFSGWGCSAAPR